MRRLKNCLKPFLLTFLCFATQGEGVAKSAPGLLVDPGTTATAPVAGVATVPGEVWNVFFSRLENGVPAELITSSTATATTVSLQFSLPVVDGDTFIEAALTTAPAAGEDALRWRTLARPAGKNTLAYKGLKDLPPPADFDEYWKRAVGQLDQVKANPRVTRVPDRDTSTGLLYKVELDSVENTTIVCWMFVPRAAYAGGDPAGAVVAQFPCIILTPGYGGEQGPVDRTKDGYVTFSTNPRNHGPSKAYWKSPVEHQLYNINQPEDYYYKLAVLDALQGARFAFSRKEVDTSRVGTEGSSQGGYLALATAMVEPRVKCVVGNVIAFSDYPDGMALAIKGGQVRLRELLADPETSKSLVRKSLAYTDGANIATRVKAAVQLTMGGIDPTCPYVCGIVTINRLPEQTARDFAIDPGAVHEVTKFMRQRTAEWQKRWLQPGKPMPIQ